MLVERAERLQRQFFEPNRAGTAWQPPVDIFEFERELCVTVALLGVRPDDVDLIVEDGTLIVAGRRRLPPEARGAAIHRIELPHGRFERRIPLPVRRWQVGRSEFVNGCLILHLHKEE